MQDKQNQIEVLQKKVLEQNSEIRRLGRLFAASAFITLLIVIGFAFWASYNFRQLKSQLAFSNTQLVQQIKQIPAPHNGINGISIVGPTGQSGRDGRDGRDGSSVTAAQIAAAVNQYFLLHPVKAVQGSAGTDGKNAPLRQLKVDVVTCQLLTKLELEDFWTPLAQLPKPCDPNTSSQ